MRTIKTMIFTLLGVIILASCNEDDVIVVDPNADLEVVDMVFTSDDLDPDNQVFSGTVKITGIVVNTGTTDFVSGTNQQAIVLDEVPIAGSPVEKVRLPFARLNAGDTLRISYDRAWSLSNEFPPSFKVSLTYDPDIFIDGNENNDDNDLTNNSITKTGYDIHNSF
ncbi:MAG: hypothetical protein R2753_14025 [Chitinophagales bacterium]